jgi:hypothetical protein
MLLLGHGRLRKKIEDLGRQLMLGNPQYLIDAKASPPLLETHSF